jgi:hypothetical protein
MTSKIADIPTRQTHTWLRKLKIAFAPGVRDPVAENFARDLMAEFRALGHEVSGSPRPDTKVIFTTAPFGQPLNWRQAKMFTSRRYYDLEATPTIFSVVHATHGQLDEILSHFEHVLPKSPPDPADYDFPGLSPTAYKTLYEQGNRGGPIMALARLLQSQTKSIRILLVVGEQAPDYAYIFDLVGAHPRIPADKPDYFFRDIALRIVTTMSTNEITDHRVLQPVVPQDLWRSLPAVRHMQEAANQLGRRKFFTEMVVVANLVHVPSISESLSQQYSEGCFATWEPAIDALLATVTGSARPVEKDAITDADLAVIVGVRTDGSGALVRHVEGKQNDPPSSESVEMMEMDASLPRITLPPEWGLPGQVPVVRSKLHGHRGVRTFSAQEVEFAPLDPPYYHYPVSCATEAQARGIIKAFSRAEALQNPDDPRKVVFTVLPGHGVVVVEKWVRGKKPFQLIYEMMDDGRLVIENYIPQGAMAYAASTGGMMELVDQDPASW